MHLNASDIPLRRQLFEGHLRSWRDSEITISLDNKLKVSDSLTSLCARLSTVP